MNGEDPNSKSAPTVTGTNADGDIRARLRPQGDGTILDKAKELALKKNLTAKGNRFCTVLSTPDEDLISLAAKLDIHLGGNDAQCSESIGLIKKLENARYSMFCESVMKARETEKTPGAAEPTPIDFDSLNELFI